MKKPQALSPFTAQLLQVLVRMAKRRRTITYTDASRLIGLTHHRPIRNHLADLRDNWLMPANAPLLTALVVRSDSGRPGDRFLPDNFPEDSVKNIEKQVFDYDWDEFLRLVGEPPDRRIWAVQSKPHYFDSLERFITDGFVALGWPDTDFTGLSRSEIRNAVIQGDRKATRGTVTSRVGAIESFVHHMQSGDIVIVPRGSMAWIGILDSDYFHNPSYGALGCSNMRAVRWFREKPFEKIRLSPALSTSLSFQFPPTISIKGDLKRLLAEASTLSGDDPKDQGRPLGLKAEESHWMITAAMRREVVHRHHELTNEFVKLIDGRMKLHEAGYDIFIPTWNSGPLLIEAKSHGRGGIARHQIREAIGQLFDYQMILERDGFKDIHLAVLVPEKPEQELVDLLIQRLGIDVIWKEGKNFLATRALGNELTKLY
jgi:hypothetical protein